MSRKQYIILGLLVIFIFGIGYIISESKTNKESAIDRIKSYKYSGSVKRLYREKKNHNSLTILLSTGKHVPTLTPELFNNLQIGDSLYKQKGSLFMFVYRNDSLIHKFNHLDAEKLN